MSKLDNFIQFLCEQTDRAIYVWGAQGQAATKELIERRETSASNIRRAKALLSKRKNMRNILAFDCSGLGMCWLMEKKIVPL